MLKLKAIFGFRSSYVFSWISLQLTSSTYLIPLHTPIFETDQSFQKFRLPLRCLITKKPTPNTQLIHQNIEQLYKYLNSNSDCLMKLKARIGKARNNFAKMKQFFRNKTLDIDLKFDWLDVTSSRYLRNRSNRP